MTSPSSDPFPPSEFDEWAAGYDQDILSGTFPFTGYPQVLAEVVRLAQARPGMSVLDLGIGTGNLAGRFVDLGCELWGTDYSPEMLKRAGAKLPSAHLFHHDLRRPFPPELDHRFDRVVSAYVFHHFELAEKAALIQRLWIDQLAPGGRLVVADISFPTRQALAAAREKAGEEWDDEPFWVASEALPVLEAIGEVSYTQVSDCAGVYRVIKPET